MKFLSTLRTLMLWFKMQLHVFAQLTLCFEESSFSTNGAFMFSLLTVSHFVSLQLAFLSESLATSGANMRFLTCVNFVVAGKLGIAWKNLQANLAFIRIGFIMFWFVVEVKTTSAWKLLLTKSTTKLVFFDFLGNFTIWKVQKCKQNVQVNSVCFSISP